MLDNLKGSGTSTEESFYPSEPEGQTEELETVENPEDETAEVEDVEESVGAETEEEAEELVYDIDGEEVNLEQLKQWKSEGLMQADYTRKTMALAEERKALEGKLEGVASLLSSLEGNIKSVESIIADEEKAVDWDELRDYDPSAYLKKKEEIKSKRDALKNAEGQRIEAQKLRVQEESGKLIDAMPGWTDTAKRDKDIAEAMSYAQKLGFTDQDLNSISDHRMYIALINGAKFQSLQDAKAGVKKKVAKAPKKVKAASSKAKVKNSGRSIEEVFYG